MVIFALCITILGVIFAIATISASLDNSPGLLVTGIFCLIVNSLCVGVNIHTLSKERPATTHLSEFSNSSPTKATH